MRFFYDHLQNVRIHMVLLLQCSSRVALLASLSTSTSFYFFTSSTSSTSSLSSPPPPPPLPLQPTQPHLTSKTKATTRSMSMAPTDEFPYVRGVGKEQDVYLGFSPLDFAQFQQVCGVKPHHLDPSNAFKDSTWKFPPLCPPYLRETRGACVLIGNDVVGILQERGVQDHYAAYRIGILGIVGPPDVTHFLTDREGMPALQFPFHAGVDNSRTDGDPRAA